MNIHYLLVLLCSISTQIFSHGFVGTTLVKTPTGYTQIAYLKENDFVIAYDYEGHCVPRRVLHKQVLYGSECITLKVENHTMLYVHPDHMFYDQEHDDWIKASDLKENNTTLLKNCVQPAYINFKDHKFSIFEHDYEFYDLTIDEYHNYCVTYEDILVHNQWWGGVAARYGGYVGGYTFGPPHHGLSDAEKRRLQESLNYCGGVACGGGGRPPKKDDDDDWELVYKYSERERRQFGRSERSHERRAEEHRVKLEKYRANPDKYDNLGFLKDAGNNHARRQDIIRERINHLKDEIRNQTRQAQEARLKANEKVLRRRGSR